MGPVHSRVAKCSQWGPSGFISIIILHSHSTTSVFWGSITNKLLILRCSSEVLLLGNTKMKQISKYVTLSDTNATRENEVDRKVHREIRVTYGAKIYLQKTIIHREQPSHCIHKTRGCYRYKKNEQWDQENVLELSNRTDKLSKDSIQEL